MKRKIDNIDLPELTHEKIKQAKLDRNVGDTDTLSYQF